MNRFRGCALLGALSLAAVSQAVIIIDPTPGNFPGDENLLFNQPGLIASGPLVQGMTNQTHFIVDLYDAGEDLVTPPGGQARVEALDGNLTDMKLKLHEPGATFGTLIWNLNAAAAGNVTLTIKHIGGPDHVESFSIVEGGQNYFRIQATEGDAMEIAQLHTDVQLMDVKQIRIGSLVPEPTTVCGIFAGLMILLARRAKR